MVCSSVKQFNIENNVCHLKKHSNMANIAYKEVLTMKKVAEICCDSLEGALIAEKAGADRIELNSSMYLYGLTPSIGTIDLVTRHCHIPILAMVRQRPGGFRFNENEFQTMYADIEEIGRATCRERVLKSDEECEMMAT